MHLYVCLDTQKRNNLSFPREKSNKLLILRDGKVMKDYIVERVLQSAAYVISKQSDGARLRFKIRCVQIDGSQGPYGAIGQNRRRLAQKGESRA